MKFKTGDKIRAINDAKQPVAPLPGGLEIAYKRGDEFFVNRESIEDSSGMRLIIWHPIMGEIEVNAHNFELV